MKFEMPCDIVCSLMPEYINGVLDGDIGMQMKEHIFNCCECRRELENMSNINADNNDVKLLKRAKRKINKKIICVAIVAAIVAAALACMGMSKSTVGFVPYDKVNVYVEEIAFEDINWLSVDSEKNNDPEEKYVASLKFDGDDFVYDVSEENYNKAKENGRIQYIHLTSNYNTDSFSEEVVKVNDSYICIASIDTDNKKVKNPMGPSWIQYDPIDKIVYKQYDKLTIEALRTNNDDLLENSNPSYHVIWESEASKSFCEPKLLFEGDKVFGKAKAKAQIKYRKSYDEGELRYAFFISAVHENNDVANSISWSGAFCDLDKAINGSVDYDDLEYCALSSNEERYYWEIVPNDCDYALVDGEKLYTQTAEINLEGKHFTVKYIAGAVENKAGKKGYDTYKVTLYDTNGNAHTAK